MSNPVAGQDFIQGFETTESLVGATVTVEYKKPNGEKTRDVVPTSVDTDTGIVTYLIPSTLSTYGMWLFQIKVVNSAGKISWSNPATKVFFDTKET